ncbi:MAG TPA: hypothetical protein ENI52_05375 [Thermoplasmata archaeon]|nr:hypothetical protein [Thermoplasmata archaeon]
MKGETHRKIIEMLNTEIKSWHLKKAIKLRGATLADEERKGEISRLGIKLDQHHNIKRNRKRIKELIFDARDSFQQYLLTDEARYKWRANRSFVHAIHFLCDSAIPSLNRCNRSKQKEIEDIRVFQNE